MIGATYWSSTVLSAVHCTVKLCYTLAVVLLTKSYMRQVVANVMIKAHYIMGNRIVHPGRK